MTSEANTSCDLLERMGCTPSTSDGGWIPGYGPPNPQLGLVGHRYVDVHTGRIYGPKTQDGWPLIHSHTLVLGSLDADLLARRLS